jgi:hypothetical protein
MTATATADLKPHHSESGDRPTVHPTPAYPTRDARADPFDPTQGRKIGTDPYDDPAQGRKIGSEPCDDPTRAR